MNINETLSGKKLKSAKFLKTDINTPYIQKMIKKIATQRKVPVSTIEKEVQQNLQNNLDNLSDMSDSLAKPGRDNMIESVLFDMIDGKSVEFNDKTFYYLFDVILAKNKTFLKIKDPITRKRLKLNIFLVPAPSFMKLPSWASSVDTAAASPEGDLIFNKEFCKKLIQFAEEKGLKGKGSQYISNGGKVPDSYAYIEFLILHEIYHIVHADHFFQVQKKGMTPLMQNWLGDYITNGTLVKNGYPQLPMGLFSEEYNYDNYPSMSKMQDAIIKDMTDLDDDAKEQMNKQMDDHMDENHEDPTKGEKANEPSDGNPTDSKSDEPGNPKDSKSDEPGNPKDSKSDEPGNPKDSKSDEPGNPKDSKSDGKGDEKGGGGDDISSNELDKDIDNAFKETDKKLSSAEDNMTQEELDKAIKEAKEAIKQDEKEYNDAKAKTLEQAQQERAKINVQKSIELEQKAEPINWKILIRKMLPKVKYQKEETRSKMHRRTRTQIAMGKDIIPVKAGERNFETNEQSLLFILDSSGSMSDIISDISVDLLKLISRAKQNNIKSMWIIRFDSIYRVYKITFPRNGNKITYQELENTKLLLSSPDINKIEIDSPEYPVKKLFQLSWGGGTRFPKDIFLIVKRFLKDGYNQVIFTDSDILSSENIKNLYKAAKAGMRKKYSFNIILDKKSTYESVLDAFGGSYPYVSYLDNLK